MKTTRTTKRWMLTSLLFLSLTVCAAALKVTISNVELVKVTSTTVDLKVLYSGAKTIHFYASFTPDGIYYPVTSVATPSEGVNYMTYYLGGFTPGTTYYIRVEAVSAPDSDNNVNRESSDICVTTLMSEP